jgi:Family of unknown function (DUF5678)
MATITAENILHLIEQMPPNEQLKLKQLMEQRTAMQSPSKAANGATSPKQRDKKPIPDSTREMRWIAKHQREYIGQWVALDGNRLIAASKNHEEVSALADADGAYLPMFAYIDDPDKIYAGF